MTQQTHQGFLPSRPHPRYVDFANFTPAQTQASKQRSILYSLLPLALQNRLHRLPSMRGSVSSYGLRWRTRSGSESLLEGHNAMVLRDMGEVRNYSEDEDEHSQEIGRSGGNTVQLTETESGIAWKFASQGAHCPPLNTLQTVTRYLTGLSLLSLSITEATNLSQEPSFDTNSPNQSRSFSRQLYIHALSYLLRGLPADLTPDESISIRSALPTSMKIPLHIQISNTNTNPPLPPSTATSQPSLLHRTLASTIVMLFIVLQFLLPYLRVTLKAAWHYERSHRITERLLKGSIDTVDAAGKLGVKGIGIGGVLWEAGLGDIVEWVVEGVRGGVREGVGEGLDRVGVTRSRSVPGDDEIDMEHGRR
jgi:hypothetical protein